MTLKASEVALQANSSPPDTPRLPWPDVTLSDLLKDLRSHLKGDNEQLRKLLDSIPKKQCWRGCGHIKANHLHLFWSCDKLQPSWSDVAELIDGLCQCELPRDPQVFYLGLIPEGMIKKENIYMFKIVSVAVKKVITRTD
uniref:Uncharacterized protein n=1 Tax=Oreochromis niloticus TaxID=8128 RepID=A0A669B3A8_ORENI